MGIDSCRIERAVSMAELPDALNPKDMA